MGAAAGINADTNGMHESRVRKNVTEASNGGNRHSTMYIYYKMSIYTHERERERGEKGSDVNREIGEFCFFCVHPYASAELSSLGLVVVVVDMVRMMEGGVWVWEIRNGTLLARVFLYKKQTHRAQDAVFFCNFSFFTF